MVNMLKRSSLIAATVFGSVTLAQAGQVSVINPPNIVSPVPAPASVAPTVSVPSSVGTTTVVTTTPTAVTDGASGASGGGSVSVDAVVTAVASFDVGALSSVQVQQAIPLVQQLLASGSLSPSQVTALQAQLTQLQAAAGQ